MKRVSFGLLILLIGGLLGGQRAWAQGRVPSLQVGLGMGALAYRGDLNYQNEGYYRIYPAFRVSAQFNNDRRVTPQLNVMLGSFAAENRNLGPTDGIQPNTFVRTSVLTADMRLLVRILKRARLRPHVALGLGLLAYNPQDAEGNSLVNDLSSRAADETYGNLAVQAPLTLGVQYRVNDLVHLALDLTHHATTTDYLDNIGELGPRSSNDRLQTLLFSLYIVPGQKERTGRR